MVASSSLLVFSFCSASGLVGSCSSKNVETDVGDAVENLVALVAVVQVEEVDKLEDRM